MLFVLVAGGEGTSEPESRIREGTNHRPVCTPSNRKGSAEEPAKRSRLVLRATTPAEGEAVHPGTVIGIDVEYHVGELRARPISPW